MVNLRNQAIVTSVNTGLLPAAVAVNILTNQIYVSNNGSGTVSDLDGSSGNTTTITAGSSPSADLSLSMAR